MRWFYTAQTVGLAWYLVFGMGTGFAQDDPPPPPEPPQAAQQSPEQLQQLVAPIALYPDSMIAQILPAATYPDQILEAAKFLDQNRALQGQQLAQQVDSQPWDPSVKALTGFGGVLQNMRQNLAWTSELGDAYVNQPQDVNNAIQAMRQRAQQAGTLRSTPQQVVNTQGPDIAIQPASPDTVYVPEYDPWLAYGAPMAPWPGWYPYPGLYLDGPGFAFGIGFPIGFYGGYGWGWNHWRYNWRGGGVEFGRRPVHFAQQRDCQSRSFRRRRAELQRWPQRFPRNPESRISRQCTSGNESSAAGSQRAPERRYAVGRL